MKTQQLKNVGTQIAIRTARRPIDITLGFALFRDRRIPLGKKLLALTLGIVGMVLIQVLEIPLEFLTVIFASPFGLEDDLEALVWPLLLACSLLPHLAPRGLVDTLRAERARPEKYY